MIEALKEVLEILDQLTFGLGSSILMLFPISLALRTVFKIVRTLCTGEFYIPTHSDPVRSEPIQADPPKVNLNKADLDTDLKKYFDYDVKR